MVLRATKNEHLVTVSVKNADGKIAAVDMLVPVDVPIDFTEPRLTKPFFEPAFAAIRNGMAKWPKP